MPPPTRSLRSPRSPRHLRSARPLALTALCSLRKRIAQLQEYRRVGIRSLAEAAEYEAAKKKKEAATSVSRRAGAASAVSASSAAAASAAAAAGAGRSARARARKGDEGGAVAGAADAFLAGGSGAGSPAPRAGSGAASSSAGAAASYHGARPASPIDGVAAFSIAELPGASRLAPAEYALCEALALSPLQFQQLKQTIVNISLVRGHVRQGDVAQRLLHVDVAKIAGVYDFVVSCGWARKEALAPEADAVARP
jgi:transcriptional adapter 2-alpha